MDHPGPAHILVTNLSNLLFQIRALVSSQLFDTFERQQLEATLQSMSDIALCPRVICQCPVIVERESNMGRCPACEFAFCIYCKASFHGLDPCK